MHNRIGEYLKIKHGKQYEKNPLSFVDGEFIAPKDFEFDIPTDEEVETFLTETDGVMQAKIDKIVAHELKKINALVAVGVLEESDVEQEIENIKLSNVIKNKIKTEYENVAKLP